MRIYTSTSDPLDFCRRHAPSEPTAIDRYLHLGEGPDGRGNCFSYDDDHPPYDDAEMNYRCHTCGCRLTERD